jgi:alkylated DNA repair dioxygenase AlkB
MSTPTTIDDTFATVVRVDLAGGAWYEHAPGWVQGHEQLFHRLVEGVAWRRHTRQLYGRAVDEARLQAIFGENDVPPALVEMREALEERYGAVFPRIIAALYRDGKDSAAWEGDTTTRDGDTVHVATVSLGGARRFMLRTDGGETSLSLALGNGDLLVMGGAARLGWRHSVPSLANAQARISLMFRPPWIAGAAA